jgi:hypothetical protein
MLLGNAESLIFVVMTIIFAQVATTSHNSPQQKFESHEQQKDGAGCHD